MDQLVYWLITLACLAAAWFLRQYLFSRPGLIVVTVALAGWAAGAGNYRWGADLEGGTTLIYQAAGGKTSLVGLLDPAINDLESVRRQLRAYLAKGGLSDFEVHPLQTERPGIEIELTQTDPGEADRVRALVDLFEPRVKLVDRLVCRAKRTDADLVGVLPDLRKHLDAGGIGDYELRVLGPERIEILLSRTGADIVAQARGVLERFDRVPIEVSDPHEQEALSRTSIEQILPLLKKRLDPAGLKNYVIRPLGTERVEILMPRAVSEDVERVKRLISTVGHLEFKIVAHSKKHADLIERAQVTWPRKIIGAEPGQAIFVRFGVWSPVSKATADAALLERAEKAWPNKDAGGARWVRKERVEEDQEDLKVDLQRHLVKDEDGRQYVLATWDSDDVHVQDISLGGRNLVRQDEEGDQYVLLVNDERAIDSDGKGPGDYLSGAESQSDDDGSPAVGFNFNDRGGALFWDLTGEYLPEEDGTEYQLGIVLDNRLRSNPVIRARIRNRGIITGRFTREEVNELVQILRHGSLSVALDKTPHSTMETGPEMGEQTRWTGAISIAISLAAVIVFMAVYYRFAGLVANLALILNLLFVVALMVLFKATWTLPGLAGLVLTVGMAVDANVLIYERIREELERGASLGMAIRNGYEKAFTTILDSNLTTIFTAVVLFWIGTDQVKGFAVTLILGIATSMFTALFVTRTIFDLWYERRWLRGLPMMRMLSRANFDFLRYRNPCIVGSLIVIAVGIATLLQRGEKNFDIDFTGGTMVGVKFTKPLTSAEVEDRLRPPVLSNHSVQARIGQEQGYQYVIRTTERGPQVRPKIVAALHDFLRFPKVDVGPLGPVPEGTPAAREFQGGESANLTFEQPRTFTYVRGYLDDAYRAGESEVADPSVLYALWPVGEGIQQDSHTERQYTEFGVAASGGLKLILDRFEKNVESAADLEEFIQFGPQVAAETQTRALVAIVLSWLAIIAYVWFRFGSWTYGLAGVVALVHDVLVAAGLLAIVSSLASALPSFSGVLGGFLLSDMKIDLNTVGALLTLIGYSINDTIVIFDRIREVKGKTPRLTAEIVNRSLNETLSRSIITSLTVLMVVVILYFGGGLALHSFAFVMVVGVITGSYSTLFIATPLVLVLADQAERRKEAKSGRGRSATAAAL